jgi:hypothetical protein
MNSATAIGIFTTSGVGMFVLAINRIGPQPASVTSASALKPQISGARSLEILLWVFMERSC